MNLKTSLHIVFLVSILSICLTGQSNASLQSNIDRIISSSEFKNANLSISVIDIETSDILAEHRSEKVLVPASSIKTIFTFAAIDILGEDFVYTTNLSYDGDIEFDGTLRGNIYIEGSGDPTFGSSRFDKVLSFEKLLSKIVQEIKEEGITCIDGDIIADESIISTSPVSPSWQWNDLGNYYASGAWGININENLYRINFSNRSVVGRRPKIKSYYPEVPGLKFSNELVVDQAGTGDQAYIFGGPYNYYKRIIGTIPAGSGLFPIKGSIPDPPYFCAYHVQKALEKSKIMSGNIKSIFTPDAKKAQRQSFVKFNSPPLIDIVKRTNEESNNLYSEAINKIMGLEYNGLASGQNGIAAVKNLMRKYKVSTDGMHLEDGSGLSARNHISSKTIADFLGAFARENGIDNATALLPRAGYSGTVKSMFSGTAAKGKVWLKSGSMSRIQSYTGYVQCSSGKWVSFAIIANGFDVNGSIIRSKMQKIIQEIHNAL